MLVRCAAVSGWRCFPLYAAQAPGWSVWSVPCAARGSSPRVLHKSAEQKAAPALCAFPVRAAQAARGLTGAPSPLRGPSLSFHPCQSGACAFCPPRPQPQSPPAPVRRSLVRNWRPVCHAAGAAVLGAEPVPFPSPLPPASGGAGPVLSLRALLWTCSVPLFCERPAVCSGRLIFSLSFAVPQFKLVTHKSSL